MKDVAEVTMQNAATEVRADATVADVTASCDGTWQRRGFSSKNGVATVMTVAGNNSKVMDTETLSNNCHSCALHKNASDEWAQGHRSVCEKNHTSSAAMMEPVGMTAIFARPCGTSGIYAMATASRTNPWLMANRMVVMSR